MIVINADRNIAVILSCKDVAYRTYAGIGILVDIKIKQKFYICNTYKFTQKKCGSYITKY